MISREKGIFCIYLIGEAKTRTLIKAYIQLTQHAVASALFGESSLNDVHSSSESSGLTFTLEQSKDVALSDWALHVSDQSPVYTSGELDLHLGNTSSGA